MSERSLRYRVRVADCKQHLLEVTARFSGPLPEPLFVAMPAWTPGSYLVREYARHVESLRAFTSSNPAGVRKVGKDRWAIAHGGASEVTVEYKLYAHELTVRTNHVSATHAYWNGAATYVRPVVEGDASWDRLPCELEVDTTEPTWRIATALEPAGAGERPWRFRAADFDELVDSPVELGEHRRLDFSVLGKPHAIVLWGSRVRVDVERLVRDVSRIVETEAELFGGLPYERYTFLVHVAPGSRGGLEHRRCSSLLVTPEAFETPDGYDDFLSLVAHEFFHLWQIKRTRPEGLTPYRYERENYTRMLWLFEGGTSYYDWLLLRRAGLVDARAYLKHLASEISRLEDTPGRMLHSLEEASFDAWIKLYRPDENAVNSTVSYYLKGEVVCALLDLELRVRSRGARSLDDVIRYLWREYGSQERPVPERNIEALIAAATDVDLSDLIDPWVRGTDPLPFEPVLARVGLALRPRAGRGGALSVRLRTEPGRVYLASVLRNGAAARAGLAPGDELLAFDGRRVDDGTVRERLRQRAPGDVLEVLYARHEELGTAVVTLGEPPPESLELGALSDASNEARALCEAWLGAGSSTLWSAR